jgi:hypothetical protein
MSKAAKIALIMFFIVLIGSVLFNTVTTKTFKVEAGVKDGSVLFWQDGVLIKPILKRTGSHLTHAAVILNGYVYEAVPPRVHKVPLADYLKEMEGKKKRGFTYFIVSPKTPYTKDQVTAMVSYAESQLGRRYVLRGYNKRLTRGIFCSQLVSDILGKGGQIESDSFRESPGSLFEKLKPIYSE